MASYKLYFFLFFRPVQIYAFQHFSIPVALILFLDHEGIGIECVCFSEINIKPGPGFNAECFQRNTYDVAYNIPLVPCNEGQGAFLVKIGLDRVGGEFCGCAYSSTRDSEILIRGL